MNILHGNCDFDKGKKKKVPFQVVPAARQLHSKAHSLFITKDDRSLGPLEQQLIHFREAGGRCAAELLYARLRLSFHYSLSSHLSVLLTFSQLHHNCKAGTQSKKMRRGIDRSERGFCQTHWLVLILKAFFHIMENVKMYCLDGDRTFDQLIELMLAYLAN